MQSLQRSTIDATTARQVGDCAASLGIGFMDSPVSGGVAVAFCVLLLLGPHGQGIIRFKGWSRKEAVDVAKVAAGSGGGQRTDHRAAIALIDAPPLGRA